MFSIVCIILKISFVNLRFFFNFLIQNLKSFMLQFLKTSSMRRQFNEVSFLYHIKFSVNKFASKKN